MPYKLYDIVLSHSVSLMYTLLDFGNCLSWIESLRTYFSAVHDLMTSIKFVGIIHLRQPLLGEVISGIDDPPTHSKLPITMDGTTNSSAMTGATTPRSLQTHCAQGGEVVNQLCD